MQRHDAMLDVNVNVLLDVNVNVLLDVDVSLNSSHRVGPATPQSELSSKFFKPEFYLVDRINIVSFRPHDKLVVQLFKICTARV